MIILLITGQVYTDSYDDVMRSDEDDHQDERNSNCNHAQTMQQQNILSKF